VIILAGNLQIVFVVVVAKSTRSTYQNHSGVTQMKHTLRHDNAAERADGASNAHRFKIMFLYIFIHY
jgi:hypothetical protein